MTGTNLIGEEHSLGFSDKSWGDNSELSEHALQRVPGLHSERSIAERIEFSQGFFVVKSCFLENWSGSGPSIFAVASRDLFELV